MTIADEKNLDVDLTLVTGWLDRFSQALASGRRSALHKMFAEQSYWRDLGALTWNIRQNHGRESILDLMTSVLDDTKPTNLLLAKDRPAPDYIATEEGAIEVFFTFETKAGFGRGRATLIRESGELRTNVLVTKLVELRQTEPAWPRHDRFDKTNPGVSWADYIERQRSFANRDPQVLLVGGGQAGVMTAAHLSRLGVDALIIDQQPRVGDAWRTRYDVLQLHQPLGSVYFPFMKFPESFPEYIPRDKFAEWFETYVTSLDLNFWTSTKLISAAYDEELHHWNAELQLSDGSRRTMHPKHLVMATGGSGEENTPALADLDSFVGEKLYASQFQNGARFSGKEVAVVGVGTTAHDIAEDIVKNGGAATLLQRGPIIVVNQSTANIATSPFNGRDIPTEYVDERFEAGMIWPLFYEGNKELTKLGDQLDSELLSGLEKAGLRLWKGADDTGWFVNFFKTYGGYYLNVGASEMIIDGKIKVIQTDDIDRFVESGIVLKDGKHRHFDTVIYATGQKPPIVGIRRLLGEEIADKLGKIWGVDSTGESSNVGKPTDQEGLWIMMGGIPQVRWWAGPMSVLIAAELAGVIPDSFKAPTHPSRQRGQIDV